MGIQIKSAPRIRDRRSEDKPEPAHRFIVRDTEDSARPPRGLGATGILKGAIVVIVFLICTLALMSAMHGPDPHYVKARKLVHDYEFGKPVESRNYEHRIYGDALDELAQVNPRSKSAEAAEALRIEIERGITAFKQRQALIQERLETARVKKRRRDTAERNARRAARALPEADYPECDFEEIH